MTFPWKTNQRKLFTEYQVAARKRKLEWNLSQKQFAKLTKGNCYICQDPPSNMKINTRHRKKTNFFNSPYVWNGIDRIDSSKGYSIENCRTCCSLCNNMKWNQPLDVFMDHIRKIIEVNQ